MYKYLTSIIYLSISGPPRMEKQPSKYVKLTEKNVETQGKYRKLKCTFIKNLL